MDKSQMIFSLICMFTLAIVPVSRSVEKDMLYLVRDAKPVVVVVIPENADKWTKKAAEWVTNYVYKSSGAKLEIAEENNATNAANIISVGHTKLAAQEKISLENLKWDGCRLAVKRNVLFLLGRDDGEFKNDWGGDAIGAKGTCRAAATFLEDFLGVRWFLPIPEGVLIPKTNNIAVPADLDKTVIPAFAFLHGRYLYGVGTPGALANNYRTGAKILSYGGHSTPFYLPADKYYEGHPEYYALINGKRVKQGNHLCTSNPDVKRIILENIRKEFDNGWDWVALNVEDGYLRCQCPECEKLDNFRDFTPNGWGPREGESWDDFLDRGSETPCERLLLMYKWLADECKKSHPDKKIHLLIYAQSTFPSKKFDKFPDNVVGEVAFYHKRLDIRIMDMWKDKVQALTAMQTWFDLTTGSGGGMGVSMTPQEAANKIRTYHKKNVIGVYAIYYANWGLQGPSYYVLGKMAGSPDLDYDALVNEYCLGLYGKAGKAMKDFFDILYSRSAERLYLSEAGGFSAAEKHLMIYPPAFLQGLEPILAKVENMTDKENETAKKLIALTRLHFDYLKLITAMQAAYQAYQATETPENLKELEDKVNDFEDFRLKVISLPDEQTRLWPAHDMFCKFLVGGGNDVNYYVTWDKMKKQIGTNSIRGTVAGFSGSAIRKPITLNFKALKQQKKKTELTVKRMPQPPKIDGLLDDAAWGGADVQAIVPMTKENLVVSTTVRAVYDHENLYIAFECEEPQVDKLKLQEVGKDGNVWALDHVELFFDPEKSTKRRYQLMAAPCANATYDARIGFKGMMDGDASWNGNWSYGFNIDKENRKWTIELCIPFSALNMEVPQDGNSISANFGRARYAGGTYDPELYLWSQGETGAFSDPAAFGTLVFKHVLY